MSPLNKRAAVEKFDPAVKVAEPYEDVLCPHCRRNGRRRYIGAFVGKAQCPACKSWVTVALTPQRA